MLTSLDKPNLSLVEQWEEAGASLANTLANYLKLSNLLETSCMATESISRNIVDRIDLSLQTLHTTLDQQFQQSRASLARTRNRLAATIYNLPQEILSEIFMNFVYSTSSEDETYYRSHMRWRVRTIYHRLYNLAEVCTLWRNVALSRPFFWSIVPMVDPANSERPIWRPLSPALSVERSGHQGLHFALYSRDGLSVAQTETLEALADHFPRARTVNIVASGPPRQIPHLLEIILRTGVPESLSELALCCKDELTPETQPNIFQFLNSNFSAVHHLLPQLWERLSVLRIDNIPMLWEPVAFSTRLVELRVEKIVLAGNSQIAHFTTALCTALELRTLTIIHINAFADQGSSLPLGTRIVLPKLQSLYLEDLYFNFLLFFMSSLAPGSYHLTLNPSELLTKALTANFRTGNVRLADAHRIILRFPIDKLIIADDVYDWLTPVGLHNLLRSTPRLKTLVWNYCSLNNELLKGFEPPSGKQTYPFPKLEVVHFRSTMLSGNAEGLKAVVAKHPIRDMVFGVATISTDQHSEESSETEEEIEVVRWLEDNVPRFQFISQDTDTPEISNMWWKL